MIIKGMSLAVVPIFIYKQVHSFFTFLFTLPSYTRLMSIPGSLIHYNYLWSILKS